jgi:predicted TIM-barrel fold metal-dependent hydrolase
MVIIDADVHISPATQGGNTIQAEDVLRSMERAGVDKVLAWLQPPYLREIDNANEYIFGSSQKHPEGIIGFGWADPNLGLQKARDMVKKCIYEYGFPGIKLNGAQNPFYIDDPNIAIPIIEDIAKVGAVLALHVGADAYEQTHPFRVGKIARLFPEMQILMVHMGGAAVPDLSESAIEVARENPNITVIGSAVAARQILKAIKTLGASRVCFGSDTPFALMHVEKAKYDALLDGEVTTSEKAQVMGGNIARVLGL